MAKPPLPWREIDDKTPVEYVQENPKKIGSNAFDFYEKYKKSKTFGEAKANGARAEDFRFDYAKGLLKIHFINAPKVSKGLENKGPTRKAKPDPRAKPEPKPDAKTLMKADLEAAKDKVAPFPTFARSSGADSPKLPRSMAVGPLGSLPSRARKVPEETEGANLAAAGAPGKKSPGSKSPKSPKSPPGSKADPKEPASTPVKRKADGQPEESKDTKENKKAKKEKSKSKSSGNSASSSPRRAKANSVVGQPGSKSPGGSKADSKATASSATKRKADLPLKEKKEKKDKRDKKDKKDKKEKRHGKLEKKHKKEKREKRRLTGKSSPTKAGEASSTKAGQVSKSSKDRTRKGINISFGLAKLLKNSQGKTKGALSKKSSANGKDKKSSDHGSKQDADGLWVRTGDGKTCTSKYVGVIKSQSRGYRVQFNHAYLGTCETEQ
ncbi:PBE1, partial [Symbiodinium sp. KB8]